MDPIVSWALFGTGVAAIGYYYYTENQKKIARAREIGGRRRGSQPRLDVKEKKFRGKDSGSSDQVASDSADVPSPAGSGNEGGAKKRKSVKTQPSKLSNTSAVDSGGGNTVNEVEEQEDDGMNNAEFAQQFMNKQIGTDLKKPAGPADNQRNKKQSKSQKAPSHPPNGNALEPNGASSSAQWPSAASSTTGADADDDLSPANSPQLGALSNTTSSGVDVSDMLEAPGKGPSVLNITAPSNPQPVRQPRPPKPVEEPESKRARQNRKKREEQKVLREEAEQERRRLLEKQLRTVREAEGRPAKNGLGISSKAPANNAWTKTAEINGGLKASLSSPNQSDTPLLDTFDDSQSSANGAASVNGRDAIEESSPQAASTSTFTSNTDLPSEEEQLRIINEMDSDNAWSTVNKGGKSKKATKLAGSATPVPNDLKSSNASNGSKAQQQQPASKFSALDVEHSTEEASSLDKEEEVAAFVQPSHDIDGGLSQNLEMSNLVKDQDVLSIPSSSLSATNDRERSSPKPADGNQGGGTGHKSVTGLPVPEFVHSRTDAAQVASDPSAEDLPEGWYHFDNGCRSGHMRIPHHDVEYERQLQKHARWTSDNPESSVAHRTKARLERDAYDKCFLVYRAHLARTLDSSQWNKENIKDHPAYEPDWPWALLPHPSESWNAGYHEPSRDCLICEDYSR